MTGWGRYLAENVRRPRSQVIDLYGFGPGNVGLIFPMIASHFS